MEQFIEWRNQENHRSGWKTDQRRTVGHAALWSVPSGDDGQCGGGALLGVLIGGNRGLCWNTLTRTLSGGPAMWSGSYNCRSGYAAGDTVARRILT